MEIITTTKYIAKDGTEFDNFMKCEAYERALTPLNYKMFDRDGNSTDDETQAFYAFLKTQADLDSFIVHNDNDELELANDGLYEDSRGLFYFDEDAFGDEGGWVQVSRQRMNAIQNAFAQLTTEEKEYVK